MKNSIRMSLLDRRIQRFPPLPLKVDSHFTKQGTIRRQLSSPTADRLTGVVGCHCCRTVIISKRWRLTCTAELLSNCNGSLVAAWTDHRCRYALTMPMRQSRSSASDDSEEIFLKRCFYWLPALACSHHTISSC